MSDWGDETPEVTPHEGGRNDGGGGGNEWGDFTPCIKASQPVSGWSDDEGEANKTGADNGSGGYRECRDDGVGGGGGYRGRRDDGERGGGGGGYRGRRVDGERGGDSYRGHRADGEDGGDRGRCDDGEGRGGGGYRGRREDGEGGGYRGRRDDGEGRGGGYRERRDNGEGGGGGGGGYRGRRDDGETNKTGGDNGSGGYRGCRDDGVGGGGGYRGRRDDGERGGGGGGYRGRRVDGERGGDSYRGHRADGEDGGDRGRCDDGEGRGGGGYRGRREDGEGGGYRGRRDDGEGRGGGYRERRDNGEGGGGGGGGYRGRRDDGEGRGGGGYRERREDGEECGINEIGIITKIPKSYDKDTVSAFMNQLDMEEYKQFYQMRELRDYLLRAYNELITQEWDEYIKTNKEKRKKNALESCQAADMSQRINEYMIQILEENDAEAQQQPPPEQETEEQQQRVASSSPVVSIPPETDWPIMANDLVLPAPTDRSSSHAMPGLTSSSPRTQPTRGRRRGQRTRGGTETTNSTFVLPSRILQLYTTSRHSYVENEISISLQPEDYLPPPRPLTGLNNRFPRWLSEEFLSQHEMRGSRTRNASILRQELEWPSNRNKSLTIWSNVPQLSIDFHVDTLSIQEEDGQLIDINPEVSNAPQGGSALNFIRNMLNAREGGFSAAIPSAAAGGGSGSLPGLSLIPPRVTNSHSSVSMSSVGMAANITDVAVAAAQMSPINELPENFNLHLNSPADATDVGGNTIGPLEFRSQSGHLIASTPLLAFRPRLSAIVEEQQQQQQQPRGTFSDRLLQRSENLLTLNELSSVAPTLHITPPPSPPRDWSTILRPLPSIVNYSGMIERRAIARNRRPPRPPNPVSNVENEQQPISNQEIMTSFLTNIIQATMDRQGQHRRPSQELQETETAAVPPPPTSQSATLEQPNEINPLIEEQQEQDVNIIENTLGPGDMLPPIPQATTSVENLTSQLGNLPPDRPIVTNMSIICQPSTQSMINAVPPTSVSLCPLSTTAPSELPLSLDGGIVTSNESTAQGALVLPSVSGDAAGAAPVDLNSVFDAVIPEDLLSVSIDAATTVQLATPEEQFYRENQNNLSFLVQHADILRLMVDHTKELSDKQQNRRLDQLSDTTAAAAASGNYRSLPAIYTFDPNLILDANPIFLRMTHAVFGALIMLPKIDMHNANFINNPVECIHANRVLIDLKSAGIVGMSDNGGEWTERRRRDDNDMNNNEGGEDGEKKPREFYIPPEPTTDEAEMFNNGIASGINFAKYDKIPVKVSGENPPQPIKNFEEAQLRDIVLENVIKSSYKVPTPIQKVSIPVITAGRDLMACAQTGSGKTAAFLLPILSDIMQNNCDLEIGRPHAIVVSPTRELAIQIYNEARKFAHSSYLKISIVYGGTSVKYQNECITKGCHVLIATPGRLLDFVDRTFITFDDTRFVVLDEADRMLDMGFSESMRKIIHHRSMRPEHQTLMFSATFPEEIQRLAGDFLKDYIFVTIGVVGGACSDVTQTIYEVDKFNKRAKLMEILREGADGTIVFVETKRAADFLASFFSETEFPTTSIHGDRLQSQREQALRDFKSGRMKVLIATSVASRGLDIKNVSHVINFDMPSDMDDYVHRIGRTGRVGNKGRATSFFDPDHDRALAGDLVKILEGSGQEVPEFLRSMGGGGGFHNSEFGGFDVRGGPGAETANIEEEQDWD